MQQAEKVFLAFGSVFFGLGLLLAMFNPEYYHNVYSTEDGVLEWLAVLILGTIAYVMAVRLWHGYGRFNWKQRMTLLLIALLAGFGAGEEISWGQRLFDVSVPEFFDRHNAQRETNLHNLVVAGVNVNKLVFAKGMLLVFLVYLCVLTPLYHRSSRIRSMVDDFGAPMPKRYQVVAYFIVILAVEGLLNLPPFEVPRRGELTEFMIPLLVALNVIFPLNRDVFLEEGSGRK